MQANTWLTRRHPLLYTADSKAILDIKTPSDRSAPFPSLIYNPKVCPGRFTISTNCNHLQTFKKINFTTSYKSLHTCTVCLASPFDNNFWAASTACLPPMHLGSKLRTIISPRLSTACNKINNTNFSLNCTQQQHEMC